MTEHKIKRRYWTIGQVARKLRIAIHTARFWSNYFKLFERKKRNWKRLYSEAQIEILRQIKFLLKKKKYTLEGAKQQLNARTKKDDD